MKYSINSNVYCQKKIRTLHEQNHIFKKNTNQNEILGS